MALVIVPDDRKADAAPIMQVLCNRSFAARPYAMNTRLSQLRVRKPVYEVTKRCETEMLGFQTLGSVLWRLEI